VGVTLLLVDGSGHGPYAAHAAETAARAFTDNIDKECVPLVEAIHRALAPTRGAALAVARIDAGAGLVRFVGVGKHRRVAVEWRRGSQDGVSQWDRRARGAADPRVYLSVYDNAHGDPAFRWSIGEMGARRLPRPLCEPSLPRRRPALPRSAARPR
jgi:hypothetical protein